MIEDTARRLRKDYLNNDLNTDDYVEFRNKYPKFYDMLTRDNMNNAMLEKLFELLREKEKQNLSEFKAASEFSQFGAEKYLYNQFQKPSQNDIKKAEKKLSKLY